MTDLIRRTCAEVSAMNPNSGPGVEGKIDDEATFGEWVRGGPRGPTEEHCHEQPGAHDSRSARRP